MAHVHPAPGFSPPTVSFSPLVHSNLCLLLIPPMRLRSLSNSITVDLMATEKIEDTDNLTSYATDVVSCNCVSCTDSFKLEPRQESAPLFAWSAKKKKVKLSQVTQCLRWMCTFCSCFVVHTLQLQCIDMSGVINYSCVFLSLTVKKAVSTVSERLSLPPAGWKYEENCEVSEPFCFVLPPGLFINACLGV